MSTLSTLFGIGAKLSEMSIGASFYSSMLQYDAISTPKPLIGGGGVLDLVLICEFSVCRVNAYGES